MCKTVCEPSPTAEMLQLCPASTCIFFCDPLVTYGFGCRRWGIKYTVVGYTQAWQHMFKNLDEVGKHLFKQKVLKTA
jgi:hypothetical protein